MANACSIWREQAVAVGIMLKRRRLCLILKVFQDWRNAAARHQRMDRGAQKVLRRWRSLRTSSVFGAWSGRTSTSRVLQRAVQKIVFRMSIRSLSLRNELLLAWFSTIRQRKWREQKFARKLHSKSAALKRRFWELMCFHSVTKLRRKSKMRTVLAQIQLNLLKISFSVIAACLLRSLKGRLDDGQRKMRRQVCGCCACCA